MAGIINQTVWGHAQGDDVSLMTAACYYTAFGYGSGSLATRKEEDFITLYRIQKPDMSIQLANWFLYSFVIPSMPDRIKPHVSFRRLFNKRWSGFVNDGIPRDGYTSAPCLSDTRQAWLELRIKKDHVCADDAYILSILCRHAQEEPQIVSCMADLHIKEGYPLDVAFLFANEYSNNYGHCLLYHCQKGPYTRKQMMEFSIKKLWAEIPIGEPISRLSRKQTQVNNHFTPAIQETAEREQRMPYLQHNTRMKMFKAIFKGEKA